MGLLSRLGFKNRKRELYQKHYEDTKESETEEEDEVEENDSVKIGDSLEGTGSSRVMGSKKDYYDKIKQRITDNDEQNIRRIAEYSNNLQDVFRKMEDDRIPLEYLVALGFAEDIDIESYNNSKVKGLSVSQLEDDLMEEDKTLRKQIEGYMEEIPELKRIVNIGEDSTEEEKEEVYQKAFEEIEKHSKESEEKEEEREEVNKLRGLIDKYKITKKKKETVKGNRLSVMEERRIKVVGDNVDLPMIRDYRVEKVTDFSQIVALTSNRKDILVVANTIPDKLQMQFLKWLKGLESADNKYRIVTLKGKELHHPLIEETIELTKESVDAYLKEFVDSRYTGKDVKGFNDIDKFFE